LSPAAGGPIIKPTDGSVGFDGQMPALTLHSSLLDGLGPLLRRACGRAARLGQPVLASLTAHVGPAFEFDLLPLLDEPEALFWEQPHRGLSCVAVGAAVRFTAAGEGRFQETKRRLQALLDNAAIDQDSGAALWPAPLSFSGFSFDPGAADDPAWFGFAEAMLVVPQVLVARSGSHLFVTTNALIDGGEDADAEARAIEKAVSRLLALDMGQPSAPRRARLLDPGPEARAYWDESVRGLTGAIARGEAEKVVLARRVQVEAEGGFDLTEAVRRLRQRFPECTVFAVKAGDACFLGATPEMLVSLRRRTIRADCLAGSAPRGRDEVEDRRLGEALLADDKERREHALVAKGLLEALAEFSSDIQAAPSPCLRRFANLQHLHTPIEATAARRLHVLDLVERLHPSAATAGLPRQASLRLLREHEPFSRGWYAGPLGWIDSEGGGEFVVGLRSALVREDVATLYAGCGIVPGSDPAREYRESELKLNAMLHALDAAPDEAGAAAGQRGIAEDGL